jgi:hypothetical protein
MRHDPREGDAMPTERRPSTALQLLGVLLIGIVVVFVLRAVEFYLDRLF